MSEIVLHLFVNCPVTKLIWETAGVEIDEYWANTTPCIATLLFDDTNLADGSRRCCLMWGIWKVRNKYVFDSASSTDTQRIIDAALKLGVDYAATNAKQSRGSANPNVRWTPPEIGWYKINTDAGLISNNGGQVGAVVRNSDGDFIAGAIQCFPHINHPMLLEALGYKVGLELACSLGLTNVIMESDCKPIITAMNNYLNDRSDLALIIEDCLEVAGNILGVQHQFIPRIANEVAYAMAKLPCLFSSCPLVLFSEPNELLALLAKDRE